MEEREAQDREQEAYPTDAPGLDPSEGQQSSSPVASPNPWLIGTDLQQARKRIRWGFGAGLAAAIINFIVIMSTYFVGDTGVEGVVQPSRGEFIFVLVEAGLVAALAYGVLKRSRAAAATLLAYQLVSKSILFGLALTGLGPGNLNPVSFVLNLAFAYLFFQGLRGTLTWHYLTHPEYPAFNLESNFHEGDEETPGEEPPP